MHLSFFHLFAVAVLMQTMTVKATKSHETEQQDYDYEDDTVDKNLANKLPNDYMRSNADKKPRKYYSGIPRSPIIFLFDDQNDNQNSYPNGCNPSSQPPSQTEKPSASTKALPICENENELKLPDLDGGCPPTTVDSTTKPTETNGQERPEKIENDKNGNENANKNDDKIDYKNTTSSGDTGSNGSVNTFSTGAGSVNTSTTGAGSAGAGSTGAGSAGTGSTGAGSVGVDYNNNNKSHGEVDQSQQFFIPTGSAETGDPKQAELQMLIQHLYVAQARVQLETSEIKRAQSIATAAQDELEEATNRVRTITIILQSAQQSVAAAAIRAQTAQLQVAAHDQLLFAARQDVDVLASQVVSMQALQGIETPKIHVDMTAVIKKLKEPLGDAERPTPVPTIIPSPLNKRPKSARRDVNEEYIDDLNAA